MKTNEPLAFVAGQHYTTRDGREARVYATDGNPNRPIHGAVKCNGFWVPELWSKTGKIWSDSAVTDSDLISPWIEKPVVNWAAMPAWAQWLAMNGDGVWEYYEEEPCINATNPFWSGPSSRIPPSHAPTYTGDWRNSKVQRPQV
jgi:hypothetical protein